MSIYRKISLNLSIVACLNLGLGAIFQLNILETLFINYPIILKIIYVLFGIAGMVNILFYEKK